MADNKRYYYLKLKENFFDSDEIKVLESLPNGIYYSNLLIKLYLKSLKFDGALKFNEFIPYDENMIATITNLNVDVVRTGLKVLSSMKLIERLDDGTIYMISIQSFIGKSSSEADRKRLYREQIEEEKIMLGQVCDKCPPDSGTNSDKRSREIETEKELEIEIETEIEKKSLSVPLINYFEKVTGIINGLDLEGLKEALAMHGEENVKMAIDRAAEKRRPTMKYINGILNNWAKEGYPKKGDLNVYGTGSSKFTGFKPKPPRTLSEEERKLVEGKLL